ncbi:MAG: hypothetical protein K2K86_05995, partial [Muribaculaceae bacterium]|nr:hypothetical protein [Muribaculaceae bacterium]
RDALSIFDQVAASSRGEITYRSTIDNLNVLDAAYFSRLVDSFLACDVPAALLTYKEIRDHGFDSHAFINGLAAYIRDLMVTREESTRSLVDTDEATLKLMSEQASKCTPTFLYQAMSLCNDADLNYRQASAKTFLVELLLIKLCQLLSPSPIFSGDGEGQLKPIAVTSTPADAAATATQKAETPREAAPSQPKAPSSQPAASPANTYTPPAAPTATRRPRTPLVHTVSIRNGSAALRQEQAEAATPAVEAPKRSKAYTTEQLVALWKDYMMLDPTKRILLNTMRASLPVPSEDGRPDIFTVTVEIETQREELDREMPSLLGFIHDRLENDPIAFD